jgi:two-component system cell cycle response regulator
MGASGRHVVTCGVGSPFSPSAPEFNHSTRPTDANRMSSGSPPDRHRDPLPRLTRRVFTDLGVWMMGLGFAMGVAFPFFVVALGVPSRFVLTPWFFLATVGAGLIVGSVNQALARAVVGSRLRFLRSRMSRVEENLREALYAEGHMICTPETCSVPVDSDDELGAATASFNHLVDALAESHEANMVSQEFANALASHLELAPLVTEALELLQRAGGFDGAALCLLQDGELQTVSSLGFADTGRVAESEPVRRAARTLEPIRLELPEDLVIDGGAADFRPRTVIAFPLHLRSVPVGVLLVASTGEVEDTTTRLINQQLPGLAVAVNNALSHERLQRVAAIDPLTGLANRRFGLERLAQEFGRAVRAREPLGVILFDIDHFKSINDTYGHQVGDQVLRTVADAARGVLREGDTLMRYGGEEFLAVLPGAGSEDLHELGERVRREIEGRVIRDQHHQIRVTVSLGAVAFPSTDVANLDDLIRQADAAMYHAKSSGRNRLAFAA